MPSNNPKAPITEKPKDNNLLQPKTPASKYGSPDSEKKTDPNPPKTESTEKTPSSKYSSPAAEKLNPTQPSNQTNPNFATQSKTNPNITPESRKPNENATSKKPTTSVVNQSANASAAKEEQSRRAYVETQQAKAPPKSVYKTPEGKTVNVNTESVVTKTIREKPSSYYQPAVRQQRTDVHIHEYHYHHPSSWYYSQPTVYVGGGYNSAFWWMMMEWDAERRAQWFYNHQNSIERDAYQRGMQDAAVAQRVAELKAQNARVNPDYVDPEFAKDPSVMYTQDHIEAVYNPTVVPVSSGGGAMTFFVICGVLMLCVAAYVLMFVVRWGK